MAELFISRHVILFDKTGKAEHFDVTCDFRKIAEELQSRAMRNRSHISVVAGGAVIVEHLPS